MLPKVKLDSLNLNQMNIFKVVLRLKKKYHYVLEIR